MADTAAKYLSMTFTTPDADHNFILNLPDPKTTLDVATIDTFMDLLIAKNILLTPGGELVGIHDAGVVERTFTDFVA